jgi:short-subunit dehydrogenase
MSRFLGTVTFITGASSGIGAALAKKIARQGGDVAICARRKDRLNEVASTITSIGRKAIAIQCDVTKDGDLEQAVAHAVKEFGRIDYVFANAGYGVMGTVEKLSIEDYRRQFETNVFGVLRTFYATRDQLIKNRGCIGMVGSVNSYLALPNTSAYCMSKFAVYALAESLWYEMKPHGVGVVFVAPGFIDTDIRKIDNSGIYHEKAKDPVPKWLMLSADAAGRQIANALYKRKHSLILTYHGKIMAFLNRHFPCLVSSLIRLSGSKGYAD